MAFSTTKPLVSGPDTPLKFCGKGTGTGDDVDNDVSTVATGATATTPDTGGADEFVPNCLVNVNVSSRLAAAIPGGLTTIGVQDFCLEVWAMPFGPGSSDVTFFGGATGGAARQNIQFDVGDAAGAIPQARAVFGRAIPPGGSILGGLVNVDAGWHYYAVNFDRSGNMVLYIDGVAVDTTDISAGVADNINEIYTIEWGAASAACTAFAMGPCAWHLNTLLTAAQMADSIRNRGVQQLAGTVVSFNPRFVVGAAGWNSVLEGFFGVIPYTGPGGDQQIPIPFAAPAGTNGTVYMPDLSGNGYDAPIATNALYAPGVSLAVVCFGDDPFWR